jgi:hypothetical protein
MKIRRVVIGNSANTCEELVFTFEASQSGKMGVIYLDNIALQ